MTDKKKSTNSAFSQQQRTQISNACEQVQNAININNSTLNVLNEDLVRKADEIAMKWKAYGLPYNAIRDAVIEMALWQKEQIIKSAIDAIITSRWKDSHVCLTTNKDIPQIYNGDKVKILIVKEDEQ